MIGVAIFAFASALSACFLLAPGHFVQSREIENAARGVRGEAKKTSLTKAQVRRWGFVGLLIFGPALVYCLRSLN